MARPLAAITMSRRRSCAASAGSEVEVESTLAHARGFIALKLGPRVLRTETAALAALAALNTRWGDF